MSATDSVTMYGTSTCTDCRRSRRLLDELRIPYRWIDIAEDPEAAQHVRTASGRTSTPYIELSDGTSLTEPSDAELEEGLRRAGILTGPDHGRSDPRR